MSRTYRAHDWRDERQMRERRTRANALVRAGIIRSPDYCGTKTQYATQSLARGAAKRLRQERGGTVQTYRCPLCHQYHLTRRPYGE